MVPLDGIRGIAALVVVVHHVLLASSPSLASGYLGESAKHGSRAWWLSATPLHLLWAGPEAVVVFFVLSGFVLALPATKRGPRWFRLSYYPKRLTRLYLPVWGAILLAGVWRLLQSRPHISSSSWWLQQHSTPMTLHRALDQASLRDLGTWAFDPVLWSLHWEVLYSVLLPVAVLIALFSRRAAVMAIFLLATALVGVGWGAASANSRAEYLPMFLIGALLAVHWPRITAIVRRASSPTVWGLTIASVFLLTTNYWLRPGWARDVGIRKMLVGTSESAVVLGAATVIVLAIGRNSWGNALQRPSIRWLGSRSYSLYLVHEPLVVSIAFAFRARETTIMLLAIALPAALVLAEVFWRTVERPSIGLAYRLGSLVDRITTIRSRSVRSQGIQELASVD